MYLFPLFYVKIKRPQIGDRGLQFDLFVGCDRLSDNITTSLTVDHSGYVFVDCHAFYRLKTPFVN